MKNWNEYERNGLLNVYRVIQFYLKKIGSGTHRVTQNSVGGGGEFFQELNQM
jgi:hypothetical protein